jgi:hypothetical protein
MSKSGKDRRPRFPAASVLEMIGSREFADWYKSGQYSEFIAQDTPRGRPIPTECQVLESLTKMLKG